MMAKPMKYFLSLLFAVSVLFTPSAHAGSIVTAATCNRPDVQVAINAAQDGDTVVIPAGTCHWTTTLAISPHAVTIQGAGIDQTIIVDDVPKTGGGVNARVFEIDVPSSGAFRFTGMTFQGGSTSGTQGADGLITFWGSSHSLRVDHIKMSQPHGTGMHFNGAFWGVIDHCIFDMSGDHNEGIYIQNDGWPDGSGSYGDGSFADALYLGTEKALYIETNNFTGSTYNPVVDSAGGSRIVFRYNNADTYYGNHGTETTGRHRGARSFEIYNNVFAMPQPPFDPVTGNGGWFTGTYLRSGTGVIFNNTWTGFHWGILMADYRSPSIRQAFALWGICDGTNAWDGNVGPETGYPCLDQVGRGTSDLLVGASPTPAWPHQLLQPVYAWANTWNPVPHNPGGLMGSQSGVIVEDRDYFTNTPMPGYTPYTYPHPLTLTGTPPGPPLSPPTNLRLID